MISRRVSRQSRKSQMPQGQAALLAILIVSVVGSFTAAAVSTVTLSRLRLGREVVTSLQAYQVGEGGVEDGILGLIDSSLAHNASDYTVTLNGSSAVVSTTQTGSNATINSVATATNTTRALAATLTTTTQGVSFHYGVQVGDAGLTMGENSQVTGNVYSNGSIVGSNGSTITGDAVVAGGLNSDPSVQWTTQNADYFFATASSNRNVAQSFTASVSDKLNKVSVYLGKVGAPGSNLTLRINSDNSNKPDTNSLATATIAPAGVGVTPSWIDVALSSPPTLVSGTKYWIVLDYGSNSATNYWNWRKDSTDGYANNTGKYTDNCCSGHPTWSNVSGDLAFRVWLGGTTTKIQGVTIGSASSGSGRANLFTSATIHGSSCPNQYCIIDNPSRAELPISSGLVQDWRDAAAAGGTCAPPTCDASGNFIVSGGSPASLGPKKITGNLDLSNGSSLTVTGTLWVVGNVSLSNNCNVHLASGYGTTSGVIVVDGTISVSNNCTFSGSGNSSSYLMLLSAKNAPTSDVIDVSNNALGVIYYAMNGLIDFSNGASAKEATGYGIELSNNASIIYESGLANASFSTGPSGGWSINTWQEIE